MTTKNFNSYYRKLHILVLVFTISYRTSVVTCVCPRLMASILVGQACINGAALSGEKLAWQPSTEGLISDYSKQEEMALLTCLESYRLMLLFKSINWTNTVEESIAGLRSIRGMKSNMRNRSTLGINTTRLWGQALFQKCVLKCSNF